MYFVDGRIFFQCQKDLHAEQLVDRPPGDYSTEAINYFSTTTLSGAVVLDNDTLECFGHLPRFYTQQTLSFQGDALRPLAGITRRMSQKAKCQFLQGLPTAAFDAFIVFWPMSLGGLHRRQNFPSYSWAGWRGQISVTMPRLLNQWLEEHTWIIWYKRSSAGVLDPVWDPSANESFPMGDLNYPGYRLRRPFRPPPGVEIETARTYPTQTIDSESMPKTEYPLLQFWTVAAYFKIRLKKAIPTPIPGCGDILTADGTAVGKFNCDTVEETSMFTTQDSFEFILLAWNERHERYNAILLEWKGPVAERRGCGTLDKRAFKDCLPPGPKWKEIILG